MIKISHVVALSNNNVIGVDNNLPWNLKSDLVHFKTIPQIRLSSWAERLSSLSEDPYQIE